MKTLVEIAHTRKPEGSKMASMLLFESFSTAIFLQFSPYAMFKAHRIVSVSAIRGEQRGMLLAQTLSTTPRSFLAITAKVAFD